MNTDFNFSVRLPANRQAGVTSVRTLRIFLSQITQMNTDFNFFVRLPAYRQAGVTSVRTLRIFLSQITQMDTDFNFSVKTSGLPAGRCHICENFEYFSLTDYTDEHRF